MVYQSYVFPVTVADLFSDENALKYTTQLIYTSFNCLDGLIYAYSDFMLDGSLPPGRHSHNHIYIISSLKHCLYSFFKVFSCR